MEDEISALGDYVEEDIMVEPVEQGQSYVYDAVDPEAFAFQPLQQDQVNPVDDNDEVLVNALGALKIYYDTESTFSVDPYEAEDDQETKEIMVNSVVQVPRNP